WRRPKGIFAGQNAFAARWSTVTESLPPENSSTGLSNSAATSRMMWMASDSKASRVDSPVRGPPSMWALSILCCRCSCVQSAFCFVRSRPASGAGVFSLGDGAGAGLASDRGVALRQQWIDRHLEGAGIVEEVVEGPGGQGVDLDQAVLLIEGDQR